MFNNYPENHNLHRFYGEAKVFHIGETLMETLVIYITSALPKFYSCGDLFTAEGCAFTRGGQ